MEDIWVFQYYEEWSGKSGVGSWFHLTSFIGVDFPQTEKKEKESIISFTSPLSPGNLHWDCPWGLVVTRLRAYVALGTRGLLMPHYLPPAIQGHLQLGVLSSELRGHFLSYSSIYPPNLPHLHQTLFPLPKAPLTNGIELVAAHETNEE